MNLIEEKSFAFSVQVVQTVKAIRANHKEYELTRQFVRSGTSIGANVCEAVKAQSRNDFIAKMSIASKEANETQYWIKLLEATGYIGSEQSEKLKREVSELIKILTSIVKTTQEKKDHL